MALFDFLKRKKEVEKAKKKREEEKPEALPVKKQEDKKSATVKKDGKIGGKQLKGFSFEVIQGPHISEKASLLSEKNQYVFRVLKQANKQEIKKSVEGMYGVKITSVRVTNSHPKKRRLGQIEGWKKGYKKAIVTVQEGQKIELL